MCFFHLITLYFFKRLSSPGLPNTFWRDIFSTPKKHTSSNTVGIWNTHTLGKSQSTEILHRFYWRDVFFVVSKPKCLHLNQRTLQMLMGLAQRLQRKPRRGRVVFNVSRVTGANANWRTSTKVWKTMLSKGWNEPFLWVPWLPGELNSMEVKPIFSMSPSHSFKHLPHFRHDWKTITIHHYNLQDFPSI